MTTYFKDFAVTDRTPRTRALQYANAFAAQRGVLGHNVRRIKIEDEDVITYRVYFSPSPLNFKEAVHA